MICFRVWVCKINLCKEWILRIVMKAESSKRTRMKRLLFSDSDFRHAFQQLNFNQFILDSNGSKQYTLTYVLLVTCLLMFMHIILYVAKAKNFQKFILTVLWLLNQNIIQNKSRYHTGKIKYHLQLNGNQRRKKMYNSRHE